MVIVAAVQDTWGAALQAAGATVVHRPAPKCMAALCEVKAATGGGRKAPAAVELAADVDVAVCRKLSADGVPLVTRDWAFQCLVHHRVVDVEAHPSYQLPPRR